LVTTFATTPILHLITRHQLMESEAAATSRPLVSSGEPDRSAILVPVADPQGVAVLVELALAATPPNAPPPRVLALVRPPLGGVRSGLREAEQRVAPRSPALSAALDHAWERGAVITPQAVWSDDPPTDILRTAADAQIGWVLLGAHRAVFGSDFTGGVVHRILDSARRLPVNVGVVIHSGDSSFPRVCAVADCSAHGRAAIGLASRIASRKTVNCTLSSYWQNLCRRASPIRLMRMEPRARRLRRCSQMRPGWSDSACIRRCCRHSTASISRSKPGIAW